MVMAAQFESFRAPFIIMFSVPFGIVGVILAIFVTGITLNVTTFIGAIMLIGIVVNNGIVFVTFTIQARGRGMNVHDALIESGRARLRPILMTTITTILGVSPMAISRAQGSEHFSPMAIAIIGGLAVSTLITLVLIPVLYSLFESRSKQKSFA